ncbi:hypothetical protein FSP39_014436 [Pinctada imbricata]|uniref:INO80 complex subunit E N-terminal domain-containing protein n=1 Tax=Pinctada imbricata TaxID=66713 RepID=A0AA89BKK1_PINIB|nr:hypothetical protein FSP39_014436 [Pinctada imbricata]
MTILSQKWSQIATDALRVVKTPLLIATTPLRVAKTPLRLRYDKSIRSGVVENFEHEQECFLEELRKAQRKLLKTSRDRSFLLDRLLQYEKVEESSGDSDITASSDSEAEGASTGKNRHQQNPLKKKPKSSAKKSKGGSGKGKSEKAASHLTREEIERHLESRQNSFGIEKAPAMLPMEIFSNDNSNPDSDAANDLTKDDYDSDLVIDAS